jgi:hypothetical protein
MQSAYAKAQARQSSLSSATRAKTGGKGIRTPDIQLAKLALYQLSYAPFENADCRLPIVDCNPKSGFQADFGPALRVAVLQPGDQQRPREK